MDSLDDHFRYVYSSSLNIHVPIKIVSLEGVQLKPEPERVLEDPMLKFSGLHQQPCADLMVMAQVWEDGRPLSLPVWTSYKSFTSRWNWSEWLTLPVMFCDLPRRAQLCLTVYDCVGPTEMASVGGTTVSLFGKRGALRQGLLDLRLWPGRAACGATRTSTPGKAPGGRAPRERLARLAKKHRSGLLPEVDWLDRLVFRELEMVSEAEKRAEAHPYLVVEFPDILLNGVSHCVVWYDQDGDEVHQWRAVPDVVTVPDAEVLADNLAEDKHRRLARSLRHAHRDAKPNAADRDALHAVVAYPPTRSLSAEEQDLLWKFRFYLSKEPRALGKFLQCVNWTHGAEARQALELLRAWAPMGADDALQLLSPAFAHPAVRRYAVSRLRAAPDDDLLLYLLQLVQALRYESPAPAVTASGGGGTNGGSGMGSGTVEETTGAEADLATFLIERACENEALANYLYWYLLSECEDGTDGPDSRVRAMYLQVLKRLVGALDETVREGLQHAQALVDALGRVVRAVAREGGGRARKAERLRALLADPAAARFDFAAFPPLPLPLDPSVRVVGVRADDAALFRSALAPARLTFATADGGSYTAILKHGDDLRQDQLVLQIVSLLDQLLRRDGLDLRLTPYRVLATSARGGLLQFIDSVPLAQVLAQEGSIQAYLRKCRPAPHAPFGIAPDVLDAYVRSCAGYCVITYVLGVGDRHLDNLLLTPNGKLFHVDFGYILGRDPKPLPPPMKLSKEMVEAMGGPGSEAYAEFRKHAYTAFLAVRRHASLLLNLLALMADASVPDIALEPDKAVKKVQDKLRLDLSDEEAVHHFQTLLDLSVTAVMAALVEQLHKFAQYWRK